MENRMKNGIAGLFLLLSASAAPAEVMLQWFETEWDEIYRRLPEVAETGYDYLWLPPPTKAPTGQGTKWGNVGYNLYDRFDLGDIPQRGSLATRYGTRGDLRNMVDKAHQCDVKIIPDIIMNHNGNGPDFRRYPGMKPEDFHLQWEEGHLNTLNYKRGPRMGNWSPWGPGGEGTGATLWEELVSLIDIRTESDGRFTGGNNTPGWNLVADPAEFIRHPGQYDRYPDAYDQENVREMLLRWILWLGDAMDYDGLRLDAGKHVNYEFFGTRGTGFLHEAQKGYNRRRGYSDVPNDEADELFTNYLTERDDALIFAEILSPWGEIEYWYGFGSNDRNPMRFLDYQIKKTADSALNGNIGNFYGWGTDFGPDNGIMYVWGHDEGPASKVNLGYAYILTHIGFPMVYFTGNNITWDDHNTRTWMRPGYDSHALSDANNELANLVWVHQQFARGEERDLWHDGDYLALERYDAGASTNRGLVVVALNDSGWDIEHALDTSFAKDTVLHDYTGTFTEDWGDGPGRIRVGDGGSVTVKVPGNGGQGWVCFAPLIPENMEIKIWQDGSPAPTMPWVVPGGTHADDKLRDIKRITSTNFVVDACFNPPPGGSVDSVMMKWGQGNNLTTNFFSTGRDVVSGRFERMTYGSDSNWWLRILMTDTNIAEGLNVIKCRAFVQRPAGMPALFNTETEVVYVDRRGPEVDVTSPAEGETVRGSAMAEIRNPDYTAYDMMVSIDGGPAIQCHETMKGLWRFGLGAYSSGNHTMLVTTTEADWNWTRGVINTSFYTRVFNVTTNEYAIDLNHPDGFKQELPFFHTVVTAPGSPDDVRLYWDGYRLPFNLGGYSNVFNGEVIYDGDPDNVVTDRLWGAFCNGQRFFEAVRVDGGVTSRVCRRVEFDLYGIKAIDSDGDSLPDNVEMPYIDSDGAPGADAPWPGDSNHDFVPNHGEYWTRLNPYNHSTFYTEQWDDGLDFDGDGFSNGAEILAGYEQGSIYTYNIYDPNSYPTFAPATNSVAEWSPAYAARDENLQVIYTPNQGPLAGSASVSIHIGHSLKTFGEWRDVTNYMMTASNEAWVVDYMVPSNATSVDFVFRNGEGSLWDNNNGADWQAGVQSETNRYFVMDGLFETDSDYTIFEGGTGLMRIDAAYRRGNLYVATHKAGGGSGDNFVFITDELNDAEPAPWSKAGSVFFKTGRNPYLSGEGNGFFETWNNAPGSVANWPDALEGEFNLIDVFGYVPEAVYIAAVAYGTSPGEGIAAQGPHAWPDDDNLDITEFLRVPIASINDDNLDGRFDAGKPRMWIVKDGKTNDANYGLCRIFLNEPAGETQDITMILEPNTGTNVVSGVELFSNINRRDFAVMEEDRTKVHASSDTNYYRAYPMAYVGDGKYSVTLTVRKCGAYRVTARYRVNGGDPVYYTDNGLRRDCAVVVSPDKALQLMMYELNPMFVEATNDNFFGRSTFEDVYKINADRPDRVNTNYFTALGVNMIWLQPIHPVGSEGRQIDVDTGAPYDPGSPYAVRDYWQVNSVLGDPSSDSNAMSEFVAFVAAMDEVGVGVMLDGTFNHSAWDCEIGDMGVTMGITNDPATLIREVRPQWYSRKGDYGEHATHYQGANSDIAVAVAPDRIDFGKWPDAADFHFGSYASLVRKPPTDTNNAWASSWYKRYLREEDLFDGHDMYTKELWEYFAAYPLYWLDRTGHEPGTPRSESYRGIDGLRCDFAQGLPSLFWEYCINRTRSVKWDFIFMAESLDGYTEVGGSKRHGVGFRSARHFDVLNENLVFYWHNRFFSYSDQGSANPTTAPTQQALADRDSAFDTVPLLLNLTSHDEIYPSDSQWRILYAFAELAAVPGVPMIFYGQEQGAQNDRAHYDGVTEDKHNFARYEQNFGKWIPNFKRYNHMFNIWTNGTLWMTPLRETYERIGRARQSSPSLRSSESFFLSVTNGPWYHEDIFGVARVEQPGISAATQDVVFAFVNNNFEESASRWAVYNVNEDYNGGNRFGIDAARSYNIVDLISTNPTAYIWPSPRTGADILAKGITVALTNDAYSGQQAQYLRLVDTAVGPVYPDNDGDGIPDHSDWDDDNDGLPDWYELLHDMNPFSAVGIDGADEDKDEDGLSNIDEFRAGTAADEASDVLAIDQVGMTESGLQFSWPARELMDYRVESTDRLNGPSGWASGSLRTAGSNRQTHVSTEWMNATNRYYRVKAMR